jgi:nucleoid DNA-binding protein
MEIKDKPESMSVRDWITKKVAMSTNIPENIIKRVISHNYDTAYEATKFNDSIEISGFGKFYYNKRKAEKEIEHCIKQKNTYEKRLQKGCSTEKERQQAENKVEYYDKKLSYLLKKKEHGNA